jgi:hypothetical protein
LGHDGINESLAAGLRAVSSRKKVHNSFIGIGKKFPRIMWSGNVTVLSSTTPVKSKFLFTVQSIVYALGSILMACRKIATNQALVLASTANCRFHFSVKPVGIGLMWEFV